MGTLRGFSYATRICSRGVSDRQCSLSAVGRSTRISMQRAVAAYGAGDSRLAIEFGRIQPDCIVGVGGGSNMDVAKFTAVLLKHPGPPEDYLGDGKIPGPTVPVVCAALYGRPVIALRDRRSRTTVIRVAARVMPV